MKQKRIHFLYGTLQTIVFRFSVGLFACLTGILFLSILCAMTTLRTRMFKDPLLLLLTCLSILAVLGLYLMYERRLITHTNKKIQRANRIFLIVGILLIQLFFLTQLGKIDLTTDSFRIVDMAAQMANSGDGIIKNAVTDTAVDGYFAKYSNNHFVVLFLSQFFRLVKFLGGNDFRFWARMLNVVFIDLSLLFTYLFAKKLGSQKHADTVLALLFVCPTTYVWLFWTYTNTLSLPFTMGLLLLFLYTKDKQDKLSNLFLGAPMGILAAIGFHIRPTVIITVIALCVSRLFFPKHTNTFYGKRALAWCTTFGLCFLLSCYMLTSITTKHLQDPARTGEFPITHWLMLGLSDDGRYNFDDVDYTMLYETKEEKEAANIEEIKKRLSSRSPKELFLLGCKKLYNVFGDGADQYTQQDTYQEHQTKWFEILYGSKNSLPRLYCKMFRLMEIFLLLMCIVHIIRTKDTSHYVLLVNYLGAMLFFLLWEANKKYNISFEWILLLLSANGIHAISSGMAHVANSQPRIRHSLANHVTVNIITATLLLLSITFLYSEKGYTTEQFPTIKKAVVIRTGKYNDISQLDATYKSFEQTFETGFSFDHLLIRADTDSSTKHGIYSVRLYDENKDLLYRTTVTATDARIGQKGLYIDFPMVHSWDGKQHHYTLQIERNSTTTNFLHFKVMSYQAIDRYESGNLFLHNKSQSNLDLAFTAYTSNNTSEISHDFYRRLKLFFCIPILLLLLFEHQKKEKSIPYGTPSLWKFHR